MRQMCHQRYIKILWLKLRKKPILRNLIWYWKCCYTYILEFLFVHRFISLFLIALRMRFHHRFLVLFFCLRFDQIGNKLQQPFRNQRHKFARYTKSQHYSNIFYHVHKVTGGRMFSWFTWNSRLSGKEKLNM